MLFAQSLILGFADGCNIGGSVIGNPPELGKREEETKLLSLLRRVLGRN